MIHTFESRLFIDDARAALLADNACHWSFGLRKAWSLLYRATLPKVAAYAELSKLGYTSEQVGSLLISAEMRHKGLAELKLHERRGLELAIHKRGRAIADKQKKIQTLEKRLAKLRKDLNNATPKPGKPRTKKYRNTLDGIRETAHDLAFCRNWVKQKQQVLQAKQGQLAALQTRIASGKYSLCFGSKKLLAQRPAAHNVTTSPFATLQEWEATWDAARNGAWWSVGKAQKPSGNAEIQWLPETKQLRIRLTDQLAHQRMDTLGVPHVGGASAIMSQRMQCRFIVIDNVDFTSHKGLAKSSLIAAFGKQPVTMRILKRLQTNGSCAWYVQASLDVSTGFEANKATNRPSGMVAVDLNAAGAAWCSVKPDGNPLVKDGLVQRGFILWQMQGKTDAERKQILGTAIAQLTSTAKCLGMAVAIENLDFAGRKLTMRAGAVSKRYNEMLSSLAYSQFAEMMKRSCEKAGIALYLVNPSYSSTGGFAKYGRLNHCSVDEAAAHWLGRQAMYGSIWKTDGAVNYVKKHDERLVFPLLPVTRMQSMKALAGVQWKDVARGLGKNRRVWNKQFRQWFLCRVETASPPQGEPALALSPAGSKDGFQSGATRIPDGGHAPLRLANRGEEITL